MIIRYSLKKPPGINSGGFGDKLGNHFVYMRSVVLIPNKAKPDFKIQLIALIKAILDVFSSLSDLIMGSVS